MHRKLKSPFSLFRKFAIAAFSITLFAPQAFSQTGPGWVTLLDNSGTLEDWNRVGKSNWRSESVAIVADHKTSKGSAFLVSTQAYKNFKLRVEFWAEPNTNSGIFIRCSNPNKPSSKSCYEVNISDQNKDPTYGTGAIVRFVEVDPMPKAGGKWNAFEITANGRHLVVELNGQKVVETRNGLFKNGPIALQHRKGVIKFRKVAIKLL